MTDVRTIRLCIANAVGVTTGEKNGERVLKAAAALPSVDIIAVSEADDIDTNDDTPVLPRAEWVVFHKRHDDDKDGTLLAFRRKTVTIAGLPSWTLSTPDHLGDQQFDINPRWALTVPVRFGQGDAPVRTVTGVHFPPPRDSGLMDTAFLAMHKLDPDLFAGDLNLHYADVAQHFPNRDVRGVELLHAVAKRHMRLGGAKRVELAGSDHPGVLVVMPAA